MAVYVCVCVCVCVFLTMSSLLAIRFRGGYVLDGGVLNNTPYFLQHERPQIVLNLSDLPCESVQRMRPPLCGDAQTAQTAFFDRSR